ncbi:MAG: hypothetical protein LPL29_07605 [Alphaproteobacteria bacterium]|nr:hypothetical protein [Alphaproteobacteria bacterium]
MSVQASKPLETLKVVAIDPAIANWGMAQFEIDLHEHDIDVRLTRLKLVTTEKSKVKSVRRNSDDLRRAGELYGETLLFARGAHCIFAEVPTGSQSARGAMSNGVCIGVMSALPYPIHQVMPSETKLAACGTKTASKVEIIAWATKLYPDGEWLRYKRNGEMHLSDANEHLADAVAIAHAGMKLDSFQQILQFARARPRAIA